MGMVTSAGIDISARREVVFGWLVEADKLTTWMGSAGAMPADRSQLRAGFTAHGTMPAPGGERPNTLTITRWEPPAFFGATISYDGGESRSLYTLTEVDAGTRLHLDSETDWAAADLSQLDTALAGQDPAARKIGELLMSGLMKLFRSGAWDNPTQKLMQKELEKSLARLKQLVEAA